MRSNLRRFNKHSRVDKPGLLEYDVLHLIAAAIHEPGSVESWYVEGLRCRAITNEQRPGTVRRGP